MVCDLEYGGEILSPILKSITENIFFLFWFRVTSITLMTPWPSSCWEALPGVSCLTGRLSWSSGVFDWDSVTCVMWVITWRMTGNLLH